MQVASIGDKVKDRLVCVRPDASVGMVAAMFAQHQVGMLVVCEPGSDMQGVVTKSDIVRHVGLNSLTTSAAASVMTREIVSCVMDADLYAVWKTMTSRGLQNLPVVGLGQIAIGVLDVRDALEALFAGEEHQEALLTDYIIGIGYR